MNNKNFYIYGAGIVATTVYTALKELYHCVPKAFIVTDTNFNPTDIDGIPVLGLAEIDTSDSTCIYVVATVVVHHESIAAGLQQAGIEKERIVLVTNDVENQLYEEFYGSSKEWITFAELNKNINEDHEVRDSVDITVFQSKSHVDKSLKNAYMSDGTLWEAQTAHCFRQ